MVSFVDCVQIKTNPVVSRFLVACITGISEFTLLGSSVILYVTLTVDDYYVLLRSCVPIKLLVGVQATLCSLIIDMVN